MNTQKNNVNVQFSTLNETGFCQIEGESYYNIFEDAYDAISRFTGSPREEIFLMRAYEWNSNLGKNEKLVWKSEKLK